MDFYLFVLFISLSVAWCLGTALSIRSSHVSGVWVNGEDKTGTGTVIGLAEDMIEFGPLVWGEYVNELVFTDSKGRKINMEVVITHIDGVQVSRMLEPPAEADK